MNGRLHTDDFVPVYLDLCNNTYYIYIYIIIIIYTLFSLHIYTYTYYYCNYYNNSNNNIYVEIRYFISRYTYCTMHACICSTVYIYIYTHISRPRVQHKARVLANNSPRCAQLTCQPQSTKRLSFAAFPPEPIQPRPRRGANLASTGSI